MWMDLEHSAHEKPDTKGSQGHHWPHPQALQTSQTGAPSAFLTQPHHCP